MENKVANKVKININGVSGEVDEGTLLLDASKQIGAPLAHMCLGNAICSICRVQVVEGEASLSEKQPKEKISLHYHLCFDESVRLACQCKVQGPDPIEVQATAPFKWMAPPKFLYKAKSEQ